MSRHDNCLRNLPNIFEGVFGNFELGHRRVRMITGY